ncbi:biopolymer transporter ExbD [bacterium]|jgi:biopolymer transport protein ExbD|nr:biopolymer transporter ExbD [bacterium]
MAILPTSSPDTATDEAGIVAEINITPLTDIFLVLLIIFMVTSSVMSQMGVEVNLPKAAQAATQSNSDAVVITLLPGGVMKVNSGSALAAGNFDRLQEEVKKAFTQTQSRTVILEGDRQAFLGAAIEVIEHAKRAGATQFSIAAGAPNQER